ncbi:MAG: hypothetical protein ACJA09_002482 [Alcanivorax sp.]|jgi:hypothetical protein
MPFPAILVDIDGIVFERLVGSAAFPPKSCTALVVIALMLGYRAKFAT